ncbi:MAG: hypothetical protein Q9171_001792 [Xanthocarpia ochracea]
MVSHLALTASEKEIRNQISEFKNIDPLLESRLISAADLLSDTYSPSIAFSTTFCIEKDEMNYAFRTLVQHYARAMTSDRGEMSVPWIIGVPATYMFHFINSYTQVWWLPLPLPWSFQIKAEVSYRIKEFVKQSSDRINTILAAYRRLETTFNVQVFQAAIEQATAYRSLVEEEIANNLLWQQWLRRPRSLGSLRENLALAERILSHVKNVKQLIEMNKAYTLELVNRLQVLNENLNTDYFSIFGSTSLASIMEKSLDDLDSFYGTGISAYIQAIKHSCENDRVFPREQYPICLIDSLRVILSTIDDDGLGMHQRSWCIEQRNALDRYQPRNRTTLLTQILLQEVIDEFYRTGMSLPIGSSPQPTLDF